MEAFQDLIPNNLCFGCGLRMRTACASRASRGGNPPPVETCDARNVSKVVMTLQSFLVLTADVSATSVRAAMAKAIAQEPPSRSYQRFYCRVLCKLGIRACTGELAA